MARARAFFDCDEAREAVRAEEQLRTHVSMVSHDAKFRRRRGLRPCPWSFELVRFGGTFGNGRRTDGAT